MTDSNANNAATKIALITGGSKRIGAVTTRTLHQAGYKVVIHYRSSQQEATDLAEELNLLRTDTAAVEVCILPRFSVAGILCTRCTPDSYLRRAKAFSPATARVASSD